MPSAGSGQNCSLLSPLGPRNLRLRNERRAREVQRFSPVLQVSGKTSVEPRKGPRAIGLREVSQYESRTRTSVF